MKGNKVEEANAFCFYCVILKLSLKKKIARDLKFAVCHRKAKKKSMHFRNMDLDNPLKLVPLNEEDQDALDDIDEADTTVATSRGRLRGGEGTSNSKRFSSVPASASMPDRRHESADESMDDEDDFLMRRILQSKLRDSRAMTSTSMYSTAGVDSGQSPGHRNVLSSPLRKSRPYQQPLHHHHQRHQHFCRSSSAAINPTAAAFNRLASFNEIDQNSDLS